MRRVPKEKGEICGECRTQANGERILKNLGDWHSPLRVSFNVNLKKLRSLNQAGKCQLTSDICFSFDSV
jgi:hypothetical protein